MIRVLKSLLLLFLLCTFSACKGQEVKSKVKPPGEKKSSKTRTLESSTAVLQKKDPFDGFNSYLDGFHFKNGDMQDQMEVHHYCNQMNEEVYQCALFDGNTKNAHLIGVEYIVSSKIFDTLPEDEKALWHSHEYQVKSGLLIAPGLYDGAEHNVMKKLVSTYGKAWHTWETNTGQNLPIGHPALLMAFTANGQLKPELLKRRDKKFGISTRKKEKQRANIKTPAGN